MMEQEKVDNLMELAAVIAGKADKICTVLVLYTTDDKPGVFSLDNGISVSDGLYLIEAFRFFMMNALHSKPEP